jgi:hypothetical protein
MNYYEKEFNAVAKSLLEENQLSSSQEQHSVTKSAAQRPSWMAKLAGRLFHSSVHKTEKMSSGLDTKAVGSM